MASICEVCGKGIQAGCNVSHSNRHSKRAWKPNIQQVRAVVNVLTFAPVACVPVKLTALSDCYGL